MSRLEEILRRVEEGTTTATDVTYLRNYIALQAVRLVAAERTMKGKK